MAQCAGELRLTTITFFCMMHAGHVGMHQHDGIQDGEGFTLLWPTEPRPLPIRESAVEGAKP